MAGKPSSPGLGRRPLVEKSVNLHQTLDVSDISSVSSRSWLPFRSWSSSARRLDSEREAQALEARSKFVLVLLPLPNMSLTCFLTQVCGGPLESISQIQYESMPLVLLEFVHACHAGRFRAYVNRGHCAFNGRRVSVLESPGNIICTIIDKIWRSQQLRQMPVPAAARRTLHIFKPATWRSSNLNFKWEQRSPHLVRSRLDIRFLVDTFSRLGHVLQVRPMLYQQYIAFAVDFDCIASAVNAKTQFDYEKRIPLLGKYTEDRYFSDPDFEGWRLEYSRDSTERACVM